MKSPLTFSIVIYYPQEGR